MNEQSGHCYMFVNTFEILVEHHWCWGPGTSSVSEPGMNTTSLIELLRTRGEEKAVLETEVAAAVEICPAPIP